MKRLIIFLMAGICLLSCSTARFQPHTDTYSESVRIDTTFVLDSVYVDRIRTIKAKADTVYVTDYKTEYKYRYRDRIKIDTLVLTKTEVVKEMQLVPKELSWWQNFRLKGFWYLLGLVTLWVIWKVVRFRLHLWVINRENPINPAGEPKGSILAGCFYSTASRL